MTASWVRPRASAAIPPAGPRKRGHSAVQGGAGPRSRGCVTPELAALSRPLSCELSRAPLLLWTCYPS